MRRAVGVGGAIAAAGIGVLVAGRSVRAHLAEGTLPGRWGSWVNSYLGGPLYRGMAQELALSADDEVLDIACGWGEFLVAHGAVARRVAGVDWSEAKVALARGRLAGRIADGTAEVVCTDATALPWAEGTFTAVTCMDAFPFLPDPNRTLAEAFRVLRPGGRVLMQIGMRWRGDAPKHIPHPRSRSIDVSDPEAVAQLVRRAGFEEVRIHYCPASAGPLGRAANLWMTKSDELQLVSGMKPQ